MAFCSGRTVSEIYLKRLERSPDRIAFVRPDPHEPEGRPLTWREFHGDARIASLGLLELGVNPGDRVMIRSGARYEGVVGEIAILGARGVSVPLDPLHPVESLEPILSRTGARVLFVENSPQLERIVSALEGQAPTVVIIDAAGGLPSHYSGTVISWERLRELGQARENREGSGGFERRLAECSPDDPLWISLTSGTTDLPHPAILTHRAAITAFEDLAEALGERVRPDEETLLSYLPFTHHFGRIETMGGFYFGWRQAFSEGPERVQAALRQYQPTLMVSAPRLLEKFYARYHGGSPRPPQGHGTLRKIATRAARGLAERSSLKNATSETGQRLRTVLAIGGPLPGSVTEFCRNVGIDVLEGYGLAEVCGPVALTLPGSPDPGSSGKPLGQVSVRISDDGEIWIKSPRAGVGLDREWLKTGDLGWVDGNGYLHVQERRTDLIVTSSGDVVFPQEIESRARLDRFIRDFVIVGEDRRFLSALVTLRREEVLKFARDNDILFSSYPDLIRTPQVRRLVQKSIDRINTEVPSPQAVRRFCLIPNEFSVEGGELTPSRRPKRRQIHDKYQEQLRALYQDAESHDTSDQTHSTDTSPS